MSGSGVFIVPANLMLSLPRGWEVDGIVERSDKSKTIYIHHAKSQRMFSCNFEGGLTQDRIDSFATSLKKWDAVYAQPEEV